MSDPKKPPRRAFDPRLLEGSIPRALFLLAVPIMGANILQVAYQVVDAHTNYRLRKWLCRKHRVQGKGIVRFPNQYLYETLRLVRLPGLTRNLPWAKA